MADGVDQRSIGKAAWCVLWPTVMRAIPFALILGALAACGGGRPQGGGGGSCPVIAYAGLGFDRPDKLAPISPTAAVVVDVSPGGLTLALSDATQMHFAWDGPALPFVAADDVTIQATSTNAWNSWSVVQGGRGTAAVYMYQDFSFGAAPQPQPPPFTAPSLSYSAIDAGCHPGQNFNLTLGSTRSTPAGAWTATTVAIFAYPSPDGYKEGDAQAVFTLLGPATK
jgi:hypothetical protein